MTASRNDQSEEVGQMNEDVLMVPTTENTQTETSATVEEITPMETAHSSHLPHAASAPTLPTATSSTMESSIESSSVGMFIRLDYRLVSYFVLCLRNPFS